MNEFLSASLCPSCARPVATTAGTCLYCGAVLPADLQARARENADRIRRAETLPALSASALAPPGEPARRHFVLDVADASEATLVTAFAISAWEARQWRAGPRYRLIRVAGGDDAVEDPPGLLIHVLEDAAVQRARNPLPVAAIDDTRDAVICRTRPDPEGPLVAREIPPGAIRLIVSAPIRRERTPDAVLLKRPPSVRLEDGLLVHLHVDGEPRPFEIDARRTAFEGDGPPSAFMRTLALLRRLSETVPLDDSFRLVVPALAPAPDTDRDLEGLRKAGRKSEKEPRKPIHDNSSQFRAYSAWRGVLARDLPPSAAGAR